MSTPVKTIALDIGETLVRDDRYWASWADWFGAPRHTLSALVGAVVSQGRHHTEALRLLRPGVDLVAEHAARESSGRGEYLDEADLYPDVRPTLTALRERGVRVVVAGNQTARAGELLRGLNLPVAALHTSEEWGVAKPSAEFFARVVECAQAAPSEIVYVGDRPSNDVIAPKAAGLRCAHLRRGPWGLLWADSPEAARADWRIDALDELLPLVDGAS